MTDEQKLDEAAKAYALKCTVDTSFLQPRVNAFKAGADWQKEHLFDDVKVGTLMPFEPTPDPILLEKLNQIIEMIQRQNQRTAGIIAVDESGENAGFVADGETNWQAMYAEMNAAKENQIKVIEARCIATEARLAEAGVAIGKWRLRAEDAENKLILMTKIATGAA